MSPQDRAEGLVTVVPDLTTSAICHRVRLGRITVGSSDREGAQSLAVALRLLVASAIEAHMAEAGLGEPPMSDERLAAMRKQYTEDWLTVKHYGGEAGMIADLFTLVDHLRAQVAWLANEQGCAQAHAAGKASCVCRFCGKAPEVCMACYERDLLTAEER